MGFVDKLILYLVIALGIVLFLKLDNKISLVNRVIIAIIAVVVLLLLFIFISAILTIIIVVVLLLVLVSLLERKNIKIFNFFRK